jgi:hypothetical protein
MIGVQEIMGDARNELEEKSITAAGKIFFSDPSSQQKCFSWHLGDCLRSITGNICVAVSSSLKLIAQAAVCLYRRETALPLFLK